MSKMIEQKPTVDYNTKIIDLEQKQPVALQEFSVDFQHTLIGKKEILSLVDEYTMPKIKDLLLGIEKTVIKPLKDKMLMKEKEFVKRVNVLEGMVIRIDLIEETVLRNEEIGKKLSRMIQVLGIFIVLTLLYAIFKN